MKYKVTIVIVVSVLLLAGGIFELIYITKTFNELIDRVDEIALQNPYDLNKIYETEEWLEKKHKSLEIIVPHFQLNELSTNYAEFIGAVEAGDNDSAKAQIRRLQENATRMSDIFKFKIQNIL